MDTIVQGSDKGAINLAEEVKIVIKIDGYRQFNDKNTILTAWVEVATACSIAKKTPTMAGGRSASKAQANRSSKASLLTDGCFSVRSAHTRVKL